MTIPHKIPPMGKIHWEQLLKGGRRGVHAPPNTRVFATEAIKRPLNEELNSDLSQLMNIRGQEEAEKVVPAGRVRKRLKGIADGDITQEIGGGIGAVGAGLLGAGTGALAMRLARGPGKSRLGLLGGIPAAIGGYSMGKGVVRDQQMLTMLDEELGPGAGIKRAYVEEGFDEILTEMRLEKLKGTFSRESLKKALRDLKAGRGHDIRPTERHLIRRHLLDDKNLRFEDSGWKKKPLAAPPTSKPAIPRALKSSVPRAPKPKPPAHWIGKKPLVIAGGIAALAGLGLTAAKLWPKSEPEK